MINKASTRIVALASLLAILTIPISSQTIQQLDGKNVSITGTNFKGRTAVQVIANTTAKTRMI